MNENESYTIKNIRDFDPVHTFECGQCFRWEKQPDGSYTGAAMGRIVNIRFDKDTGSAAPAGSTEADAVSAESVNGSGLSAIPTGNLTITPCTESEFSDIWRPYLDLDRDYTSIKTRLSQDDDIMKQACKYGYGIRILKQDLWETIVSFIISQNNNIPRIKGCIERLCDNFGEPISTQTEQETLGAKAPKLSRTELEHTASADPDLVRTGMPARPDCLDCYAGTPRFNIPAPEVLAGLTVDDLAPVRLGYRAKYLIETAKAVCENGLPREPEELSGLCGVGPKVASCIALFGMQDFASFPIDVWVMKVMHELYGLPEKDKKAMAAFARERFGELGGFAQQYLFYYMRDRS